MITVTQLEERKTTIETDIKKVEETLSSMESQREQLQANLFALRGAFQQVDFFIDECGEKKDD